MTADAVRATFAFYDEYQDYWYDESAWEDEYGDIETWNFFDFYYNEEVDYFYEDDFDYDE